MLALVEAVERAQHRLQRWALGRQGLSDRQLLLLGMLAQLAPATAFRLQPAVQLLQAGEAQARLEEPSPGRLDLVFDLALLPARRRGAGRRLHHVVARHDQEAPVEHPVLAREHRRHRRLHVVVDPARRHAAEEGERPRMRVEQHLLGLARIGPNIDRPRGAQPHVRHLHPHRLARDLHVLVAPVELVGLARPEHQRDERWRVRHAPASLQPPPRRVAPDRVVRPVEPLAHQQVMNPRHPQLLAPRPRLVLFQQLIEPGLERRQPRQRLHRPPIGELRIRLPDRLAHHLARQSKVTRDRLDRLPGRKLAPNPQHRLQHQHPELAA